MGSDGILWGSFDLSMFSFSKVKKTLSIYSFIVIENTKNLISNELMLYHLF
jgi:hypothetical protein